MISEIENAIIARLQAAEDNNVLGYQLKKIESWGGAIDDDMHDVFKRLPAIFVVFKKATKIKSFSNNAKTQWRATFGVMVAAKSLRNEKEGRQGSSNKVGSYQMIQDVINLINGQTLGLEISHMEADEAVALYNNKIDKDRASIYAVNFKTTYCMSHGADVASLDDFETFNSNWDIPAFGNVDTDLPADDSADATDTTTLETS